MTKFSKALRRTEQNVPPIWFMRQAGRYHKHYQKIRAKHEFIDMCKNPELAAEVTMGPIEDFDYDVAILFSDLLFPLEALGMGLTYEPGPKLDRALTPHNLKALKSVEEAVSQLTFQGDAMRLIRQRLPKEKGLIGFVGGPWTLFSYAVSPLDAKRPEFFATNSIAAKADLDFFANFSELMIELLIENIHLQLEGGADVVMIFDPAAGVLSPTLFQHYVAPGIARLAKNFSGQLGYYSKETNVEHFGPHLLDLKDLAGIGVDHRQNVPDLLVKRTTGFVQGNFDQALLFAEPSVLKKRVLEFLTPFRNMEPKKRAGWVCGLGHGVLPQTPEDNVKLFIDIVRETFK